jgi:hypothetical protein
MKVLWQTFSDGIVKLDVYRTRTPEHTYITEQNKYVIWLKHYKLIVVKQWKKKHTYFGMAWRKIHKINEILFP